MLSLTHTHPYTKIRLLFDWLELSDWLVILLLQKEFTYTFLHNGPMVNSLAGSTNKFFKSWAAAFSVLLVCHAKWQTHTRHPALGDLLRQIIWNTPSTIAPKEWTRRTLMSWVEKGETRKELGDGRRGETSEERGPRRGRGVTWQQDRSGLCEGSRAMSTTCYHHQTYQKPKDQAKRK